MALILPDKCLRNSSDCQPLSQIQSDNDNSFICCGLNNDTTKKVKQDIFCHCWVNSEIDELSYLDRRDITDTISILAQALSVDANLENNK